MAKRRGNGEGSITQRKNGTWEAKITLEDGRRKSIYGKTRKEVQEKLKIALREQQQGTLVTTPQQKLEQFLHSWLEDTQKHSVRPRTYERYEEIVRLHIIPELGHHYVQKLTAQQVEAFYARKMREGYKPVTVASFHNVLHKALTTAVRWNLVSRNVCDLVAPPRGEEFEIQPLNLEQIRKLLAAAVVRGYPIEGLLTLALATGMRRGELLGLKWQDIDFATSTLHVRRIMTRVPSKLKTEESKGYVEANTKTKKSRRSILIAPFALTALQRHREAQEEVKKKAGRLWQEHDLVFCTSVGTPLNPDRVRVPFKELLKEAGLPDIRFHDLRHSAATLLLAMGIHPKITQEMLGHSNIAMTMDVYSHVLPGMQQEAIDRLNEVMEKQKNVPDIGDEAQIRQMSDQELLGRYTQELMKLKAFLNPQKQKEYLGFPDLLLLNECRQELERRGLPVPDGDALSENGERE
jgi:integrase